MEATKECYQGDIERTIAAMATATGDLHARLQRQLEALRRDLSAHYPETEDRTMTTKTTEAFEGYRQFTAIEDNAYTCDVCGTPVRRIYVTLCTTEPDLCESCWTHRGE